MTPIADLVAPFLRDPAAAAVLTDIDGTLAPIVERADDAAVPAEARAVLEELSRRYGLVGCVSGRRAEKARELVGLEGIAYAGNHGLELLEPGTDKLAFSPDIEGHEDDAARFIDAQDGEALEAAGLRLEDKGPIQALHWRGSADESAAEHRARQVAEAAHEAGLATHWGRKVLEVRPPHGVGKDRAVAALLGGSPVTIAAYAGDDRTDLDAFRALRDGVSAGTLETVLCVGVSSAEGPPELESESDLLVDGPPGWLAVLRELAS